MLDVFVVTDLLWDIKVLLMRLYKHNRFQGHSVSQQFMS